MVTLKGSINMQLSSDPDITTSVPCKYCRQPAPMFGFGTTACDRCYELERRIKADPEFAVVIMALNTEFIPISIATPYAEVLSKWASVSRTLTTAAGLLATYANRLEDLISQTTVPTQEELKNRVEQIDHAMEELDVLTIPLDALHQSWRTIQWLKERAKKAEKQT